MKKSNKKRKNYKNKRGESPLYKNIKKIKLYTYVMLYIFRS